MPYISHGSPLDKAVKHTADPERMTFSTPLPPSFLSNLLNAKKNIGKASKKPNNSVITFDNHDWSQPKSKRL